MFSLFNCQVQDVWENYGSTTDQVIEYEWYGRSWRYVGKLWVIEGSSNVILVICSAFSNAKLKMCGKTIGQWKIKYWNMGDMLSLFYCQVQDVCARVQLHACIDHTKPLLTSSHSCLKIKHSVSRLDLGHIFVITVAASSKSLVIVYRS